MCFLHVERLLLKIKNLKINNILSIEDAEIEFGESGLVLVEGFDYDTNRANGAGKSAIFNALSFALYDKVPRKITKSELLRKGAKSGFSEVVVDVGSGEYTVRRIRPTGVEFYLCGNKIDITQEEFESKLGLSYEQFLTTMYNAQDSSERFIFLNDRGKKEFILQIMNLSHFNDYKTAVTDRLVQLDIEKNIIKTKIDGYKNSINIYKAQIVDPDSIQESINILTNSISNYKKDIKQLELISQPDLSKYADMESKLQNKLISIRSAKIICQQKRAELARLKSMTPDTFCPECNVGLNISGSHVHKSTDQDSLQKQIELMVSQINEYETEIAKESEYLALQTKLNQKKQEEYTEYNTAQSSIREYGNSISFKMREIETLNNQASKNKEIKDAMSLIINNATDANNRLSEIAEEESILQTIGLFFDPTGAPAYIMDSVIDTFNESVTEIISNIWPTASYSLQTHKENKDKTITSKFSEILMLNGKEVSVGSLSGGELRTLSLAIDFAMIDLLKVKFSVDLNPIILDEPFNGLDSAGKEMVIELLENIANDREIWVVDHATEAKSLFTKTVRVEKRNSISTVVAKTGT